MPAAALVLAIGGDWEVEVAEDVRLDAGGEGGRDCHDFGDITCCCRLISVLCKSHVVMSFFMVPTSIMRIAPVDIVDPVADHVEELVNRLLLV